MKRLIRTCVTVVVLITALMFFACPVPDGDDNNPNGELTKITINPSTRTIAIGEELTLQAVKTPTAAAATITWTSADSTKVSVDATTGTIRGEALTSTPVRITAASVEHPEISGYCDVSVTITLKLITNAATDAVTADSSEPTRTLPPKEDNIYKINSYYSATNSKLPDSSSGFKDTTFVYIDKLLEGDFKLSVRVQMTSTPAANSTAKGVFIGAFTPVGGTAGETSNIGGILYRCSGGSVANPYAIRSVASKPIEQASVAGLNNAVGKNDEYIFEVTRTEDGYLTEYFVSKNKEKLGSVTVPYTDRAENIGADKPVFAGLAFASVKVAISQIALWDGDLTGDPVYYSG
ncbi:MAG: Ig-like domain-containing protein, partial [Treponema sp.]|nr:Ig-like domain-containing protein [Treponema sp.]